MKIPALSCCLLCLLFTLPVTLSIAQPAGPPLGSGPWILDTFEEAAIKVSVLARGMDHPFGLVFVPGTTSASNPSGDVLINERTGRIRLYRNGQLQDTEVANLNDSFSLEQLFDIKLHPQFATNGLLYFTYIKTAPRPDGTEGYWLTTPLPRGYCNGEQVNNLEEVFEAQAWSGNFGGASSRMHFMQDGTLLFGISHRLDEQAPQTLDSHIGKILRLNDDGTVPRDNPFIGVEGALPEIYTWGIRSVMDFTTHPVTGEVWELENGPQGGDEVNILRPGRNYGWPLATYGRDYDGTFFNPLPWVEGTERPEVAWLPSITVAGMSFYTGSKFPNWQGNLFVTSMIKGRVPGTGHLERVVFNENGEIRREELLNNLHQRIRYVQQGPDDLLYLLTDSDDGALLRLEPAGSTAVISGADPLNSMPLFASSDCAVCHRSQGTSVGPSFSDIAAHYANTPENVNLLANKIVQGGSGVWGEVEMAPHPDLPPDVALEMAVRILGSASP